MTKAQLLKVLEDMPDDAPICWYYDGGHEHMEVESVLLVPADHAYIEPRRHILLSEEPALNLSHLFTGDFPLSKRWREIAGKLPL